MLRTIWIIAGFTFTGLGFAGIVLPLLPGTPFLLLAAYAFAKSSPRLLEWLLGVPHVGSAIEAYRAGLGIRRRVKVMAVVTATLVVTLSALRLESTPLRLLVLSLGAIGVAYVLLRVPTRETVEAKLTR